MNKNGIISITDLPPQVQRHITSMVTKRQRTVQSVTPEQKTRATATVLTALGEFSLPQQRTILNFALDVITSAQHRWTRRPKEEKK